MKIEIFDKDEENYNKWLKNNPNGYVLTTVRNINPDYMSLHRSSCYKISQYTSSMAQDAFTGKKYIKICSAFPKELFLWIAKNGGSDFTKLCSICNPLPDIDGPLENMKFAFIPPGIFMMGSSSDECGHEDHESLHKVKLSQGFYMQTTPVTQGQWKTVMGDNPSKFKDCGDSCPVESVSWPDAKKFIYELNTNESERRYRFPTEAEWEYAARARTTGAYAGDLDSMGWYADNSGGTTHPVAQKRPNSWNLYDMHGNVCEWCQDYYGDYYADKSCVTNPCAAYHSMIPSRVAYVVIRGGGWFSFVRQCRSAHRDRISPFVCSSGVGFRLVFSIAEREDGPFIIINSNRDRRYVGLWDKDKKNHG